MRVIVPEEVVMQPRLPVAILVLQPERLVRIGNIGFLREFAPAAIVAEPQQPSLAVGHLPRQADLVAVEVVDLPSGFARFVLPFANLRQRFIRILVGIDVGIASVRVNFPQQMAAVPNEFDAAAGDGFQTAFLVGGGAVFFADFNFENMPSKQEGGAGNVKLSFILISKMLLLYVTACFPIRFSS